jgi:hypothetical protein
MKNYVSELFVDVDQIPAVEPTESFSELNPLDGCLSHGINGCSLLPAISLGFVVGNDPEIC